MKNRLLIMLFLIIPILLVGCSAQIKMTSHTIPADKTLKTAVIPSSGAKIHYHVIKIGNCEYIVSSYYQSRSITHKGNCKNHKEK